jgi:hypothetical protein
MLNDPVKDVASDESEFAINSGQGSFLESPRVMLEMRCIRMSVMQICYRNYSVRLGKQQALQKTRTDPIIHPEIRHAIQKKHGGESETMLCILQYAQHQENASVRKQHIWPL